MGSCKNDYKWIKLYKNKNNIVVAETMQQPIGNRLLPLSSAGGSPTRKQVINCRKFQQGLISDILRSGEGLPSFNKDKISGERRYNEAFKRVFF